jgi:tagatose-1,6-bisphosphate aldolase
LWVAGRDPTWGLVRVEAVSELEVEGEILAEEDAEARDATGPVRALPLAYEPPGSSLPVLRTEVRTAALAAAGGVLAGAATVAAVRAVSAVGSRQRGSRRLAGRRQRPAKVVASRSFLVDVHLLGR